MAEGVSYKGSQIFSEYHDSSPCSRETATGPDHEANESSPELSTLFL
jgi:hypothetical protein